MRWEYQEKLVIFVTELKRYLLLLLLLTLMENVQKIIKSTRTKSYHTKFLWFPKNWQLFLRLLPNSLLFIMLISYFQKKNSMVRNPNKKKHKIYLYHAFKIKRQCNWDCDIKNIAPSSPGPPEWGHTTISTLPNSRNIVSWTHPKLPRNLPAVPI